MSKQQTFTENSCSHRFCVKNMLFPSDVFLFGGARASQWSRKNLALGLFTPVTHLRNMKLHGFSAAAKWNIQVWRREATLKTCFFLFIQQKNPVRLTVCSANSSQEISALPRRKFTCYVSTKVCIRFYFAMNFCETTLQLNGLFSLWHFNLGWAMAPKFALLFGLCPPGGRVIGERVV